MNISQIALRRLVEEQVDADAAVRKKLERQQRPVLREVRHMRDEELLEKASSLGFPLTRDWLDAATRTATAAYEIANQICDDYQISEEKGGHDWMWFVIICLWERWFPERANLEMLDDRMHDGYRAVAQYESVSACAYWRTTWQFVIQLADQCNIGTIEDFDKAFGGLQCVFNWVQDYEAELWNAAMTDQAFLRERIELCELALQRFRDCDDLMRQNFRVAIAESHFELGQTAITDRLYSESLEDDPAWGWGWIGWADCYYFTGGQHRDRGRAIELLKKGLVVHDVRDRPDLLDRLIQYYEDSGQADLAAQYRPELDAIMHSGGQASETRISRGGDDWLDERQEEAAGSPFAAASTADRDEPKKRVGRNEPCPCGSGKKYKKCCG